MQSTMKGRSSFYRVRFPRGLQKQIVLEPSEYGPIGNQSKRQICQYFDLSVNVLVDHNPPPSSGPLKDIDP